MLYASPNGRAPFAEVPAGTRLFVDAEKNSRFQGTNWVAVAVPRHLSAWVNGELAPGGRVGMNNTHVRAGAGARFRSLGVVEVGTELEVRGSLDEWLRVAPPESARVWVDEALLQPPPALVVVEEEAEVKEEEAGVAATAVEETDEEESGWAAKVEIPAALAGVLLSQARPQGRPVEVAGVADWPGVQEWSVPATAVLRATDGGTFLLLTRGPADAFVGARVTASGALWWLAGLDTPLVVVEQLSARPFSLVGP